MIETLVASGGPRRIGDLSAELHLNKSNVHRVLKTLEAAGYVRRLPRADGYTLSLKLWELGYQVFSRLDIKREATDVLRELAEQTQETVTLCMLDGTEVVFIDRVESTQPIRASASLGKRAPAYAVATGKAMLAYQSAEFLKEVTLRIKPMTEKTIRSSSQLNAELARVRARGYATNVGEWRDGVRGVAAVIRGASGNIEGAIGVSGPEIRMQARRMSELAPLVMDAAAQISNRLGGRVDFIEKVR